jgi:hypothetical protein
VRSDPNLSGSLSLRTVFGGMSIRTRCVRRHIERVLLSPGGDRFTLRSFSISHAEAEDEISPFPPPERGVITWPVIHNPMDHLDDPDRPSGEAAGVS